MIHICSGNSKSTITNVQPMDIQPNAVDLRISSVHRITGAPFIFSEHDKIHRDVIPVPPTPDGWFELSEGIYDVVMENTVSIADGECGWVVPRSTLIRNGLLLSTGLYDSGYSGIVGAALRVNSWTKILKGTRIGQFVLFKAEALNSYDGSYGKDKDFDLSRYAPMNGYGPES